LKVPVSAREKSIADFIVPANKLPRFRQWPQTRKSMLVDVTLEFSNPVVEVLQQSLFLLWLQERILQ
jgi:hypothetical protein